MLLQFIAEFAAKTVLYPGAFTDDIIPAIATGNDSHDRKQHHRTAVAKKITHKGKQSIRKQRNGNSHGNDTMTPFYFNTSLTNIIKKCHKTERNQLKTRPGHA